MVDHIQWAENYRKAKYLVEVLVDRRLDPLKSPGQA